MLRFGGLRRGVALQRIAGVCALALGAAGCGSRARLDFGVLNNTDGFGPLPAPSTPQPGNLAPTAPLSPTLSPVSSGPVPLPILTAPVSGTLVDFWGHPVPQVALDVAGVVTQSDDRGAFFVDGVSEIYDISLVIHIDGEARETYGWTFEGLTRRDPVLQVYRGLPPRRSTVVLESPPLDGGVAALCGLLAVGGQHGHDVADYAAPLTLSTVWRGSAVVEQPVHLLTWQPLLSGVCGAPLSTVRHYSQSFLFEPGSEVHVSPLASIAPEQPGAITISGQVWGTERDGGNSDAELAIFARYPDGPTFPFVEEPANLQPLPSFQYTVPHLTGASVVVAASRGGIGQEGYAVSYSTHLAPPTGDVELELPLLPSLLAPPSEANVPPEEAIFEWVDSGRVSVLAVVQEEGFAARFVVTAAPTSRLVDLSHLGMSSLQGRATWTVEGHGAVSNVDAWTASAGSLSPFSTDFRLPVGLSWGDDTFVRSETRGFYGL